MISPRPPGLEIFCCPNLGFVTFLSRDWRGQHCWDHSSLAAAMLLQLCAVSACHQRVHLGIGREGSLNYKYCNGGSREYDFWCRSRGMVCLPSLCPQSPNLVFAAFLIGLQGLAHSAVTWLWSALNYRRKWGEGFQHNDPVYDCRRATHGGFASAEVVKSDFTAGLTFTIILLQSNWRGHDIDTDWKVFLT